MELRTCRNFFNRSKPTTKETMSQKTKYFFDTEFIEDGKTIDLMSIGIVCDDGRTLYRQNASCEFKKASEWVWRNVFPSLAHFDMRGHRICEPQVRVVDSGLRREIKTPCGSKPEDLCPWATHAEIRDAVLEFCNVEKFGKPQFWGYYADYDWVAFCQLFGPMIALPKGFPMYCMDLKQLCASLGDPDLPTAASNSNHHALSDALEIKMRYEWLTSRPQISK